MHLETIPGVFAAGRVDRGAAVLLAALADLAATGFSPKTIADIGCGSGILGFEALQHWPEAQLDFADADARACASVLRNAQSLNYGERSRVHWWDSAEDIAWDQVDLVLSNPPLAPARPSRPRTRIAHVRSGGPSLAQGGKALIVATKTQPFEASLKPFGRLRNVLEQDGFKVLLLEAYSVLI